jgi:2-methylcitrate dehydratase PrpD
VEGALVRNVWPGVAAWVGLRAVDWAVIGIGGRPEGLHDVYAACFGGRAEPGALTEGLGETWAIADGYHKLHACCQYAHSAVEASLAVIARRPAGAGSEDIRAIRLETHPSGARLDKPHPETTLAAKFSMQHILAATARFGHAGAEAFHAATLDDPAMAALREKVTIGSYAPIPDWPNDRPARVSWDLADGSTVTAECLSARGGPDRPFAPEEIRAKIRDIVSAPYPAMAPVLERLVALDDALLADRWDRTVRAMTAQPS